MANATPTKVTPADVKVAISAHPMGLKMAELEELFPSVNRRTLQRHIQRLLAQDEVVRDGNGPSRSYRDSSPESSVGEAPVDENGEVDLATANGRFDRRIPKGLIEQVRLNTEVQKHRKLKLANDEKAKSLLPAEKMRQRIAARFAAIRTGLEALPTRIAMRRPNLSAEDLTAIRSEIARVTREL